MNSVEKVKALCKERKIPISRLEKELGYGNGYIGQLKKGSLPDDRLVEIANYLNVSTAYFTGEEQKNKPTTQEGDRVDELLTGLSLEERARVADFIDGLIAARKDK